MISTPPSTPSQSKKLPVCRARHCHPWRDLLYSDDRLVTYPFSSGGVGVNYTV
jgi:hypothetical protein